ncbi:MAG: ParA family protein [bacterium]|nr:ParA family protein [bacterium]
MYTTTFYSFKGGVGRTMALVNSAVSLALRGRRVLVVDFDVEAPGIDTFDALRPRKSVPGLIDFVDDYVKSGVAPDVANYIGDCPDIGDEGGKLWIMPSGRSDSYATTLGQIDWMDLYDRLDGYLLFEDLKAQWHNTFQPDYVLIDSRTGHTDSSGICTRQLPDSVVILFFPNEQNLRGLTGIVHAIRSEAEGPRHKDIVLHFVMSNVPDLDDEDQILEDKVLEFRVQLGIRRDPMIVHRYDSLSLLNQVVFSKDRPRSRLAREYDQIVREISSRNWEDRDGALEYIRRAGRHRRREDSDPIRTRDENLEKIKHAHSHDGEVLFRLGEIREHERQGESAMQLISQAIDHGYDPPEALLKRSRLHEGNDEQSDAIRDGWRVLESADASPPMVHEVIRRLLRLGETEPESIIDSTAVMSLDTEEKLWLASDFNRSHRDLLISVPLFEQIVALVDSDPNVHNSAKFRLGMSYMGSGRCVDAMPYFMDAQSESVRMSIATAFNYAMARWGVDRVIDRELFERIIELDQSNEENEETANYPQCMAMVHWVVGETENALTCLNRAQLALTDLGKRSEFSCWRYLQVSASVFRKDLEEMRAMIEGHTQATPRFMSGGVCHDTP